MHPTMKDMVSELCLPDPLKCFSAWILKYTVSVGPEREGLRGQGAQRGQGLRKGRGSQGGEVGSERKRRPR